MTPVIDGLHSGPGPVLHPGTVACLKPTLLIPDHELLRVIGRGSYGEVWLARNVMGTLRAVKLVFRDRFESDRPFEREFAGIERYEPVSRSADGLVQILHVGRNVEEGAFYYVMELADDANAGPPGTAPGVASSDFDAAAYVPRTLRRDLEELGRLPVADCVELGLALAAGLAHLHRHGLVHRDLKPSNIIYVNGRAKMADVGLVGQISASRTFVGTEGYIPPEGPGTPGADVFGLGRVLYESSTGYDRERFPDLPDDWLESDASADVLEFHEISLRAGEGDSNRRYQTAVELQADLALLRSGQSLRRVRQMERRLGHARRIATVAAIAGTVAAIALLLAGYRSRIERQNLVQSERLRLRAESAEQDARQQLFESQLARAAAERDSRTAGGRDLALAQIRAAARVHPDSVELRSVAATLLALPELTPTRRIHVIGGPLPHAVCDPVHSSYASVDAAGVVALRRIEDDSVVSSMQQPVDGVGWVWNFSGDGRWLGGVDTQRHLLVWNLATGRLVASDRFLTNAPIFDFVAARDEIAIAAGGGRLEFVSLHSGKILRELWLGETTIWFSTSPEGRHVAVIGAEGIQILNGTNGIKEASWPLKGLSQRPGIAWTPDGQTLALGGSGFDVAVLSVEPFRGDPVWLRGHSAEVPSLAFSQDGRWLATASWDSTTGLWDPVSGRLLLTQPESGELTWTAGSRLVRWRNAKRDQQSMTVLKVDLPRVCRVFAETAPTVSPEIHKGPWVVESFADGRLIASPSNEGVHLWDTATGVDLATLPTDHATSCTVSAVPPSLLLTADGRMIRWPFEWNPATAQIRFGRPLTVDGSEGAFVATSDFGGRRLWASVGSVIRVWENGTNHPVCEQWGRFPKPVVSPGGEWMVVTVHEFANLHLRRAGDGSVVREILDSNLGLVGFSPDGQRIAVSSGEKIRVEEVATGRVAWSCVRPDVGGRGGPVRFSPDGFLLAAEFGNNEVAILEALTGRMIVRLAHPQPEPISSFAFTPDGTRLAIACPTHVVQVWDLRELSREESELGMDPGLRPFGAVSKENAAPVTVSMEGR